MRMEFINVASSGIIRSIFLNAKPNIITKVVLWIQVFYEFATEIFDIKSAPPGSVVLTNSCRNIMCSCVCSRHKTCMYIYARIFWDIVTLLFYERQPLFAWLPDLELTISKSIIHFWSLKNIKWSPKLVFTFFRSDSPFPNNGFNFIKYVKSEM